ncbi:hypothetical protein IAR55_002897 [Kwoniella newhampshirensis]|uniref:histidine kinase n=1 Tax=Kwoniella newhampshirensis TaxID=1651941 RepID=A0AAW0Z009_9TREE
MASVIPRHEVAPVTEVQWDNALKAYGRDRDEKVASSSTSRTPSPQHRPPSRPLVHHGDSDDSLEERMGYPSGSSQSSSQRPLESPALVENDDDTPTEEVKQQVRPPLLAFDTAATIKAPARASSDQAEDQDDIRSGANERWRLREFYRQHGWLPGPSPCLVTRSQRRRIIRRLGLVGEEEDWRKAVLAKYAEMAQLMFNSTKALISILHDDKEYAYSEDALESPEIRNASESGASHVVAMAETKCFVIADQTKDWRCQNNPLCRGKTFKVSYALQPNLTNGQFYASTSLRYQRRDGSWIDFGALSIYDEQSRDTFDAREQSMLVKLANMLVYQLATLQSEIAAKRSSAMYSDSINFLRRSVLPDHSLADENPTQEDKDRSEVLSHPFVGSRGEPDTSTPLASKSGPKSSKDDKAKAIRADQDLFEDAASTLRKMLKADSVVFISMEDYQLFIRRNSGTMEGKHGKAKIDTKERIINDYLQGKPWPEDVEAVVNYVQRANDKGIPILGMSTLRQTEFGFDEAGAVQTLADFLKSYLSSRQFWWDREEGADDLSQRIMALMPDQSETVLGMPFMAYDGKMRFAAFATWNRPPASFMESSTTGLSFVGILGGCIMAALAIRTMRGIEQSQISYSNLQAHELRTPLHQILAITQLLRSSMIDLAQATSPPTLEKTANQVQDLLPFLDAIDTSGKTLHGIVDNILSFLDMRGDEHVATLGDGNGPALAASQAGSQSSLEVMFEELVNEAIEEDRKSRRANGQPDCRVETVFEIVPPLLGEEVSEDAGALSKILANAYKFLDDEGCVEIIVDDIPDLLPPEGCEDIAMTKLISIVIKDNGKGMDRSFVRDKLGEPWAKEDTYATGSGLSVHLAYRIIDLMGGCMEIESAPGAGTIVQVDVPLPIRSIPFPESPDAVSPESADATQLRQLANQGGEMEVQRKVALVGFSDRNNGPVGLVKLGECLARQYEKLGCDVTSVQEAELVVANGAVEENEEEGRDMLHLATTDDIVYLVAEEHEANSSVVQLSSELNKYVRRYRKPATPSVLRESLFENHSSRLRKHFGNGANHHSQSINTPDSLDRHGKVKDRRQSQEERKANDTGKDFDTMTPYSSDDFPSRHPLSDQSPSVIPKSISVTLEDKVTTLRIDDYFTSKPLRQKSSAMSSGATSSNESAAIVSVLTQEDRTPGANGGSQSSQSSNTDAGSEADDAIDPEVNVLVVEDNVINRKILVRLLTSKMPVRIIEAEDGAVALDLFKDLSGPVVVLLDINMPRKDGYQAAIEMRAVEHDSPTRQRAKIIAVTALGSQAEKRKGLVECRMDGWLTKPCGKAMITKVVEEARKTLLKEAGVYNSV